jgi:hypothetical protein
MKIPTDTILYIILCEQVTRLIFPALEMMRRELGIQFRVCTLSQVKHSECWRILFNWDISNFLSLTSNTEYLKDY